MLSIIITTALHWKPSRFNASQKYHGLEKVWDWLKVSNLRLNPDKREVLLVGPDLALGRGYTVLLDGTALPHVCTLGVLLLELALLL